MERKTVYRTLGIQKATQVIKVDRLARKSTSLFQIDAKNKCLRKNKKTIMTTYNYNLCLDDRESIALTNALKCYLSPEVQAFLAANPSIGTWGNTTLIRKILENQLHAKIELASTNNFHAKKDI